MKDTLTYNKNILNLRTNLIIVILFSFIVWNLLYQSAHGQILKQIKFEINKKVTQNNITSDTPTINITYPPYPPTINTGNITIKGTANDSSGIKAVSISAHTFPFNGSFPISEADTPSLISNDNISTWSVPFMFNKTDVYRVVIAVSDNANNTNYAETTINVVLPTKSISQISSSNTTSTNITEQKAPKIAFVRPTFTESAYQAHGFHDFYFKYKFPPFGTKITTDLDMFTVKTIGSVTEKENEMGLRNLTNITSLIPVGADFQYFWIPFIEHVKKDVPNAFVTVMRDEDVNDGHIFTTPTEEEEEDINSTSNINNNTATSNKTNAYDVLLLFHNEYVTQKEYDNLRQFVSNGGTIVFIDSNVFYAQVKYDKDNHNISLVKGHDWQYDGKVATRGPSERYYNETKQWVGGNFLVNDISTNVTFTNNPFNYTHFEEQFVNNPKDNIILDYEIKFPTDYLKIETLPPDKHLEDIKIATYQLGYGKGQVIMMGLYGQNLANNEKFMKVFDILMNNFVKPKLYYK